MSLCAGTRFYTILVMQAQRSTTLSPSLPAVVAVGLGLVAWLFPAPAGAVVLLVSNEKGTSVSTVNTSTQTITGTYFSGASNPDALMYGIDGSLYATLYGTNTSNGSV